MKSSMRMSRVRAYSIEDGEALAAPVSDPNISRPRLVPDATFLEADPPREIALRRGPHNRLGFAYQVAFVRVLGRFPNGHPWRSTERS